jgi:SAM-dependent methyltransferase
MSDPTDAQLAAQYEAYPYPPRDPRDESKRLIVGTPSHLREIDYWVFAAARPKSRPLRALVAGGGTGDATIMLAAQLARDGRAGSVTYLDRSTASMAIARSRAEARGLTNIVFKQGSLLDLPNSADRYDYIDCCGVLHHLPDPAEGLAALLSVLAPGGGMGLMLYAPHGRTGVYMVQDALRILAPANESPATRVELGHRLLRQLPDTNWLRLNRNFSDLVEGGDAGLYDLLLNPRDRAFDIPTLHALLHGAGLAVTCLMEPARYDPATYLPDPKLRALAAALDPVGQAALAEALAGNISTHVLYCMRAAEAPPLPDPTAPDAVPVAREMPAPDIAAAIGKDAGVTFVFDGLRVPVALPKLAPALLREIDGTRTVADILAAVTARGVAPKEAAAAWRTTFARLARLNRILLAPPD